MASALTNLLAAALPILALVLFWIVSLNWLNGRQKRAAVHQERMANAAEKQTVELGRIADALEGLRQRGDQ